MSVPQRIRTFIHGRQGRATCDKCICNGVPLARPQQSQQVTATLAHEPGFLRRTCVCSVC